ncbi:cell division protein FtsZ [Aggregatibacter actinomycetemcomitans]|uniref:cell division protein FtsZ n=1 Tax=Aggregatibacter actinomycetemcomitans TaxID=714 RepID=UPI00197C6AFA|nr:cell division protein FtsZ [Aggregatibacter actinomycetemcomitans]MBN6071291.1 cell division protein FtsZ [Aggregatibacter actinomycetemcomitans]
MIAKVIGCGGCGSNIIDYLLAQDLKQTEFCVIHSNPQKIQEADPNITFVLDSLEGKQRKIFLKGIVCDANPCIIVCGLGGKSGGEFTREIVQAANTLGLKPHIIATTPFAFESEEKMHTAQIYINQLKQLDCKITLISNAEMTQDLYASLGLIGAFGAIHEAFYKMIRAQIKPVTYPFP